MKVLNGIVFLFQLFILSFLLGIFYFILANSYTFKIAKPNRSTEDLKAIGFEYAKNYIKSFTNHKNTKISLVSFEKPSPQNNFISKFLFVEHKEDVHIENLQKASPNKENGLVFFK